MKTHFRLYLVAAIFLQMLGTTFYGLKSVHAAPFTDQSILTFHDTGNSDILLRGPYDFNRIRFNLPPTWVLQGGTEIQLVISTYSSRDDSSGGPTNDIPPNEVTGAVLNVSFNGKFQQSIPLISGRDVLYRIPINQDSLLSPLKDGSMQVSFFLDASVDCNIEFHHTTVVVSSTSKLVLQYREAAVQMDLRRLPWPIYQAESIVYKQPGGQPEISAVVVVPDDATAGELQAALLVMSTFGRMTNRNLPMLLVTSDQVTEAFREQYDLIFVGKPSSLSILAGLSMPVSIDVSHFVSDVMQSDDGVLQLIPSPWNNSKALLVVSGNTDAGVIKAAQALSSANIQTGSTPAYSIVAHVNPISDPGVLTSNSSPLTSSDFTLADMGYKTETVNETGVNWLAYEFIIPPGQVPAEKPYIELTFSNSALVDIARSGLVIYLNGRLVGSVKFTEETTNPNTVRIFLAASEFQPGKNRIDISANLFPLDVCSGFSFDGLWLTVFSETSIHLPLTRETATSAGLQELRGYPYPFINDPSLSTTTFVLPSFDSAAWSVAGDVSYNLGSHATGAVLAFGAEFDDQIPSDIRNTRNLIVVGLPKDLSLLGAAGESLPAKFESDSNIAILENQQVTYRIASDKDLGYLEIFPSPWADQRSILTVLGTTQVGVKSAGVALTDSSIRNLLRGDFAALDGDQVSVVNTRTGLGMGRLPSSLGSDVAVEQTSLPPQNQESPVAPSNNRTTIFYALIAIAFLMVIVLVSAIVMRRPNK